jgi:HEAT repeat protein
MMMHDIAMMERVLGDPASIPHAAQHPDWEVRYAAAVAIEACADPAWLPTVRAMWQHELARPDYTRASVRFIEHVGDTRNAEMIGPLTAVFPAGTDDATRAAWACRGRVRQALAFAIAAIGQCDDGLRGMLHDRLLAADEDYPVKAAVARALARVGTAASIAPLQVALALDEWCTHTEAALALAALAARSSE